LIVQYIDCVVGNRDGDGLPRSPALANAHSYAISDVDSRHELKHGVLGGDHSIFIEW